MFGIKTKIKNTIKQSFVYKEIEPRLRGKNYKMQLEVAKQQVEWFKKHADIRNMKPATGYLRAKQISSVFFAEELVKELENISVKPFMVAGTLIGAIRHKGYIPWDDDLDFGVTRDDYYKIIEYAKENCIFNIYDGKWSSYNADRHFDRLNRLIESHPNELICDVWVDQIQFFKGNSLITRDAIDIWPFDSFCDEYTYDKHISYLNKIREEKKETDYIDKIFDFIYRETETNHNIVKDGCFLYFGIDSIPQYEKDNDSLIKRDSMFPLIQMEFEGRKFWAPHKPEEYIQFEYKNYMEFPSDVGVRKHSYWEDLFDKYIPIVEFYLVDSFEIMHFLPLYKRFLENGINARYVAEPCEYNTTSTWFDYDNAIRILEKNRLRYSIKANSDAMIAFSTQQSIVLNKYRKLKISVAYGAGVYKKGFGYTDGPIKGYDYCLVNGEYAKEVYSKFIAKEKIYVMGYPKHEVFFNTHYTREDILEELGIRTEKPIIIYYPTWDENSSISKYAEAINALRDEYFIVTKAHHCTWHLKQKKEDLNTLRRISDYLLDIDYDIAKSTLIGDYALSDLKSGASTEISYFNPNIKEIILSVVEDYQKDYRDEVYLLGPIITDPSELSETIKIDYTRYLDSRKNIMKSFFGNKEEDYLEDIVNNLIDMIKEMKNKDV